MCVENKLFPHGFNTEVFNLTGFLLDSFFVLVVLLIAIVQYLTCPSYDKYLTVLISLLYLEC